MILMKVSTMGDPVDGEATYNIEQAVSDCRAVRRVNLANSEPLTMYLDNMAKDLAPKLAATAGDPGNAIEWGRALITTAGSLGVLAVGDDRAIALVNLLAFVGLDLLDGVPAGSAGGGSDD
jgi:hypothetical protein